MNIKELFHHRIIPIKNNDTLFQLEEPVYLKTPFMRVVFPIEEKYNNLYLKLEFSNFRENKKMANFYKIISALEPHYCNQLHNNKSTCSIKSQLSQYKEYDPFILLKIPKKKNYVNATIKNCKKRTFYDIKKNDFVKATIYADILWTNSKDIVLKWKVSELEFRDELEE